MKRSRRLGFRPIEVWGRYVDPCGGNRVDERLAAFHTVNDARAFSLAFLVENGSQGETIEVSEVWVIDRGGRELARFYPFDSSDDHVPLF